jgi:hypothetical protein
MGKDLGLSEGELDECLHTVDSYQGREAEYVILDTTVCNYRGNDSLGHGKSIISRTKVTYADGGSSWR